jgi:hypothetical protein
VARSGRRCGLGRRHNVQVLAERFLQIFCVILKCHVVAIGRELFQEWREKWMSSYSECNGFVYGVVQGHKPCRHPTFLRRAGASGVAQMSIRHSTEGRPRFRSTPKARPSSGGGVCGATDAPERIVQHLSYIHYCRQVFWAIPEAFPGSPG